MLLIGPLMQVSLPPAWIDAFCRNPNFRLATKARACKNMGQEASPRGTSYTPRSAGECERMNPRTPK
jgi:hypothetical protein